MRENANSPEHAQKLQAAFFTSKLWPKGSTIKIGFLPLKKGQTQATWTMIDVMKARRLADGSPSPIDPIEYKIRGMSHEDAVKTVIKERIQPITDLKLTFVNDVDSADVRIAFDSKAGSWSLLGTDCLHESTRSGDSTPHRGQHGDRAPPNPKRVSPRANTATMNLGWMDAATIMHECGHMIGMIHEHDNPNHNGIAWDLPKLYAWAKQTQGWSKEQVDTNIVGKYKLSQLNASVFDPNSIMLYFFPASLTTDHKATNVNQRLSPVDVSYISKIYPGGEMSPSEFYVDAYGVGLAGPGVLGRIQAHWRLLLFLLLCLLLFLAWKYFHTWRSKKKKGKKGGKK